MKRGIILLLIIGLFIVGCGGSDEKVQADGPSRPQVPLTTDWKTIELTDIRTNEKFTIGQFNRPVLLEGFAVWCPTCTRQQQEIKVLHEQIGDDIISIALDVDPNEDIAKVQEHLEKNGFDWYYAISPPELTQGLIDEFGVTFVNPPSAPVALLCPDGSSRMLGRGVKDADLLRKDIERGCQ